MRVVIAGCGRVGSSLARTLADHGHDVTVIDNRQNALDTLGKSFNGQTALGQAYDVRTLKEAGIAEADVFVAVTDSDNANLMAVEVAKAVFEVPRNVARLYDPAREPSYRALGISHVTGTSLIANVIFEQIVEEEFQYHINFAEGDVEIVDLKLNAAAAGLTVEEFEVRDRLRVAALQRGHRTIIPEGDFVLAPGDLIVAAAREGVSAKVKEYLDEVKPQ